MNVMRDRMSAVPSLAVGPEPWLDTGNFVHLSELATSRNNHHHRLDGALDVIRCVDHHL
jgi:hypothetical protein